MISLGTEQTTKVRALWVIIGIHRRWAEEIVLFAYLGCVFEASTCDIHTPSESFATREVSGLNNILITIYSHIFIISYHVVFSTIIEDDLHSSSRSIEPPTESDLGTVGIHLVVEAIRIRVHTSSVSSLCAVVSRIGAAIWCWSRIRSRFFLGICARSEEDLGVRCLICSNGNSLGIFLITISTHCDGISTWSKVLIGEDTVVVVIGSIALLVGKLTCYVVVAIGKDSITCGIGKIYFSAIDRHINIISATCSIVRLVDFFLFCANVPHNISFGFASFFVVILYSTEIT